MKIYAWHGQADSLPRFRREGKGATTLDLRLQVGVKVNLDPGDALTEEPPPGQELDASRASGYLRLHRVLTDNLEIKCPAGGDFDYFTEFAGAA